MKLKNKLSLLFPRKFTLCIKFVFQFLWRIIHKKRKINSALSYSVISKKRCHVFFGYYDVSPFNPVTDELIYGILTANTDRYQIVLKQTNGEKIISTSRAWNWQQGSRLRWMENNTREICFNDFNDNNYISRIVNVDTGYERIINAPLYDISKDGQLGLSIDFERLQFKRPGYGYSCRVYDENTIDLNSEGIDLVNIRNDSVCRIIKYPDIAALDGCESNNFKQNYINHLSFSPSGEQFLFFWLSTKTHTHLANLLIYDLNSKTLKVLENNLRVSHYVWENNTHIIVTAYDDKNRCRYYRYDTITGRREILNPQKLNTDGHPSILGDNILITDTYPDKIGFQKLYIVDTFNGQTETLLSIYSNCLCEGERRTDLHPRLNIMKNLVSIDCNYNFHRSILVMSLK